MAHDILIVDDEADIRMLIAGVLKDEGYATREAADSAQALAVIHARQPGPGAAMMTSAGAAGGASLTTTSATGAPGGGL